jgi:hypothetical protein
MLPAAIAILGTHAGDMRKFGQGVSSKVELAGRLLLYITSTILKDAEVFGWNMWRTGVAAEGSLAFPQCTMPSPYSYAEAE